jgi:surfeit locus 1 family protein
LNERIASRMAQPPIELPSGPIDPEELEYRHVQVRGTFDNPNAVLLRNRAYQDITGFHLVTPLRISGTDQVVLVDRGWVPFADGSADIRRLYDLTGEVVIDGVVRKSESGFGGPPDPPFTVERPRLDAWFRVDIERIAQQSGYALLPIFIEAQPGPEPPGTPPIPSATTDLGLGSHMGYAFQWYTFAIILVVGYIVVTLRGRPAGSRRTGV